MSQVLKAMRDLEKREENEQKTTGRGSLRKCQAHTGQQTGWKTASLGHGLPLGGVGIGNH